MFDPKVHAGVAARLLRQGDQGEEVLLLLRGSHATHGANTWGLPGGWIDFGEDPAETATRELLEEVNVRVKAHQGEVSGIVTNTYEELSMHVVCVAVDFTTFDASTMENEEPEKCAGVEWIPVAKLASMNLFPPLRKLAEQWGWI